MTSSATTRLRLEKQGTGENLNTWGDRLNTALDLLDEAVGGVEPITIGGVVTVLTSTNYASDQARNAVLVLTGTLTANSTVTIPSVEKVYLVVDDTTRAGFTLTIKTSGGSGYALRPGPQVVYCDGVDVYRGTPRLDQVPVPTSAVDMNGQNLTNAGTGSFSGVVSVATPTANGHAATKQYVDTQAFAALAGSLPGQAGNAGKYLTTDGTTASWGDAADADLANVEDDDFRAKVAHSGIRSALDRAARRASLSFAGSKL
ncbi:hypothetical protein [Azospirillum soli]|uniref:hypothetical protein n=1 Tax=Azospirillum soli TaxID=1304799 RepID=UPI001AE67F86|nr:hypothetical protein [Azospirillum soli]MBP2311884.1 hypothetical protein [Azospirillum soli]